MLYHGDCLEVMQDIPSASIDMLLCDLPYGTTQNAWDTPIDIARLWVQYERIIKDKGAIVLFAQTPFDKVLGASNLKLLRYEWIWRKPNATGFLNAKKMPLKQHENLLVFYKSLPTYNPQMWQGNPYRKTLSRTASTNYGKSTPNETISEEGLRYPTSILEFGMDTPKIHPTQKPVALLEYLIRTYTHTGETVLDSCMGVGSTPLAALRSERQYIGIELSKEYYDVAVERVDTEFTSYKQLGFEFC